MSHDRSILERGDIFFLYRPAVGEEQPKSLVDVQRFFIVLKPAHEEKFRLLVVGRKRMPDVGKHERLWGFVDRISHSAAALERDLRASDYETQTRGERHFSYVLELPESPSDVQRAFKIAPEASFALSIKNPEAGSPPGAGLPESNAVGTSELPRTDG